MSTGLKLRKLGGAVLVSAMVLCAANVTWAETPSAHGQRKTKKAPPAPLPSGPTGRPVQQIPLDSMAAVPPQVSYQENQLTIVAPNSTLADILRAVRKQTGAEIEVPSAPERVVTRLGPGSARDVVAELLNGSRFNYVLLGAPGNETVLTRVVLVAKSAADMSSPTPTQPDGQPGIAQAPNPPDQDQANDSADAEPTDDNADDSGDQAAAETEQPAPTPDQPGVKTPQQMLQEMQQRQMQIQQGQNPGQPPVPGTGMQPHPPQEQ